MAELYTFTPGEIFMRLFLALFLGMLIGIERNIAGKTAGMRTYALISLAACLFVTSGMSIVGQTNGLFNFDPTRIAAGIVEGIGFLGAGVIIFRNSSISGLTSAAGMWVAAGIGVSVAYGLYMTAITATALTLFVLTILWFIENGLKSRVAEWKSRGLSVNEED